MRPRFKIVARASDSSESRVSLARKTMGARCLLPTREVPHAGRQARHAAFLALVLCLSVVFAVSPRKASAQMYGLTQRTVQGRALDANGQAQSNAVVYLQNVKTGEIRSYITLADGSYRFGQLSSDVDYRIWAKLQNAKSKARTISSFDSKKLFIFDLKLEPQK
jgi:hypothetical protein